MRRIARWLIGVQAAAFWGCWRSDRLKQLAAGMLLLLLALSPAQGQTGKIPRLGILVQNERSQEIIRTVFLPALAAHGFADGKNLVVDARRQ